jgi:catechol 2,3-dioxygenase-like lactoylglutathione lyase family enzyme
MLTATGVTPLFQVFDMRKSVAFYCNVLGFAIVDKHEPDGHLYWAMLKLGDATVMLNAKYEFYRQPRTPDATPDHSDVTLYFSCPDVNAAYEFARSRGADLKPPVVMHYGMKQLTIRDPDGFDLCFQQRVSSADA